MRLGERLIWVILSGNCYLKKYVLITDKYYVKKYSKGEIAVLLVDDDESQLKNFTYILKNNGFYVFHAQSGFEALHMLEGEDFHLMLVAHEMKMMKGDEVAMLTREVFNKAELPLVLYGEKFGSTDIEKSKSMGANDLMNKTQVNDILKRLKGLFELRNKYFQKIKESKKSA